MKPKNTSSDKKASNGIIKRLLKEAYYNDYIPNNIEVDVERFFATPVPLQGGMNRKIDEYDIQWDKPRHDVVNFRKVTKEELEEIKKERARTPRQRIMGGEVFHVLEKEDPKKDFKLNDKFDYLLMEVIKRRIPTRKVLKDVNGDIVVYTLPEATGKKSEVSPWSSQGMDKSEKSIQEIISKINPVLKTAYHIEKAFRNKSDAYTLVIKNRMISEVTGEYDTREDYLNFEEAYRENERLFRAQASMHGQGGEDDGDLNGATVDGPLWQKIDLNENIRKTIRESVAHRARYTGVIVKDPKDVDVLENKLDEALQKLNVKKTGWIVPENYHMTITLGKLPLFLTMRNDLGKEVELYVDAIGMNDDAIAFRCSGYMSRNDTQHITMLFKTTPSASKEIENWMEIDEPFYVSGTIEEVE